MAVAHAVEAGQVGARFGHGDDVVGGDGRIGMRQAHFHDLGTFGAGRFDGFFAHGAHFGGQTFGIEFLGQAQAGALEGRRGGSGVIVVHGAGIAGGVALVMTGDDAQHAGAVGHAAAQGADLVQGGAVGDEAVTGHAAVGGLDAGAAAKAGGLADGAAGIGAQGGEALAGGHGCGGTAAGSAGHALEIPGVVRGLVGGILRGGAHGELVEVVLA